MTSRRMKRIQEAIDVLTNGYLAWETKVQDKCGFCFLYLIPSPRSTRLAQTASEELDQPAWFVAARINK